MFDAKLTAVSVDGAAEMQKPPEKDVTVTTDEGYTAKLGRLIGRVLPGSDGKPKLRDPGAFDLMTQAMDLMQANLGRLRLDCAFFTWRMEGRSGVGRYDVLRRVD